MKQNTVSPKKALFRGITFNQEVIPLFISTAFCFFQDKQLLLVSSAHNFKKNVVHNNFLEKRHYFCWVRANTLVVNVVLTKGQKTPLEILQEVLT